MSLDDLYNILAGSQEKGMIFGNGVNASRGAGRLTFSGPLGQPDWPPTPDWPNAGRAIENKALLNQVGLSDERWMSLESRISPLAKLIQQTHPNPQLFDSMSELFQSLIKNVHSNAVGVFPHSTQGLTLDPQEYYRDIQSQATQSFWGKYGS